MKTKKAKSSRTRKTEKWCVATIDEFYGANRNDMVLRKNGSYGYDFRRPDIRPDGTGGYWDGGVAAKMACGVAGEMVAEMLCNGWTDISIRKVGSMAVVSGHASNGNIWRRCARPWKFRTEDEP